jgi:hypothetical protein
VDATVIQVEVERVRVTVPEGKRRVSFGGVGEAVQHGEMQRAVGLFDVAEDAAGAGRGELLIITNEPDTGTAIDGELHRRVEGKGVGHAGFIDDHQRRRADRGRPVRQLAVPQRPGELGEGLGADAGLLAKNSSRCSRWGQAEHLAAVLGPGQGEGTHGGGLAGTGRRDRQLQPGTRAAHLPDQRSLPSIQVGAVRRHLQQSQIHRRLVDH